MAEIMICSTNYAWQTNQLRNSESVRISLPRYQTAGLSTCSNRSWFRIDPAALTRHFKILKREGFVHRVETKESAGNLNSFDGYGL